jgi:glyoxylase-like metal-dependent hydrolase (beta-lactamase superfamily II)
MKEILPGVFQIPLALSGSPAPAVNAYLLRDRSNSTLVDTGWDVPESVDSLKAQLSEAGIRLSEIGRVIITHCHSDHLGLMGKVKTVYGARIYIHRKETELMKVRYTKDNSYWPVMNLFLMGHGVPEPELKASDLPMPQPEGLVPPDIILEGGEEIPIGDYTIKVIHTPGHTPGHISLYSPEKRFLVSGDVLLPTIVTNAATHIQHMVNPLLQYQSSLRTLSELEIDLVLPGHEYPFSNHRKRIQEINEHYRLKRENVLKVFESDPEHKTAYEASRLLSWSLKTRTLLWDQLKGWDKRLAALQTIALLEELTSAGKLTKFTRDGKIYYRKPFATVSPVK